VALEQPSGGSFVGRRHWPCVGIGYVARVLVPSNGGLAARTERGRDGRCVETLLAELQHEGMLTAGVGAIPRFDPG